MLRGLLASRTGLYAQRAVLLPLLRLAGTWARLHPLPADHRDARLDPQFRLLLWFAKRIGMPSVSELTPAEARDFIEARYVLLDTKPTPMQRVSELAIALEGRTLQARVYTPTSLGSRRAALVFFHGGGWVVGSLDSHDRAVRVLAHRARVTVISVDYRLAPEHPFPAAAHDAIDAFRWVTRNARSLSIDPSRIAVGGDSAGGNLAAVVALRAVSEGFPPPCLQLLVYPVLDLRQETESYRTFAEGYLLTKRNMDWYIAHYLGEEASVNDPLASPLASTDLSRVAPALIATAGYDPLRDEGAAYATRLSEAGVRVTYRCYAGMVHAFIGTTGAIDAARSALFDIAAELEAALA